MAEDANRTRAAAYIDERFHEERRNLVIEHRRQEQRMLAYQKSQLQGFAVNREQAEQRYVQRLRSIEQRRDRIADRLQRQHNSFGGRLRAMTRQGRARQAEQLERLNDRAAQLQGHAHRNFASLQERQFKVEQEDRIFRAREIKFFRVDHLDERQRHAKQHEQNRPVQIEERSQSLKRAEAEQALKRELQQLQHSQGRTIGR